MKEKREEKIDRNFYAIFVLVGWLVGWLTGPNEHSTSCQRQCARRLINKDIDRAILLNKSKKFAAFKVSHLCFIKHTFSNGANFGCELFFAWKLDLFFHPWWIGSDTLFVFCFLLLLLHPPSTYIFNFFFFFLFLHRIASHRFWFASLCHF